MVTLNNIEFSYTKGFPALSGVSVQIEPGIHLLAGENGAGKTTLLRMMAGIITPLQGSCSVYGRNPAADSASQKGNVFIVEEDIEIPGKNIREFASLHSRFYPHFSPEAFTQNLKDFGLSGHEPLKSLSLGNRKKALIAYALALGVDLLMLDEPTNGLDIQSKSILKSMIARSISETQTLIVATHTVGDLENLFDGAIMMSGSRVLFAAPEEKIAGRLAFTVTSSPIEESIYSETSLGKYLSISRADGEETRADWRLLYCGLNSPQRDNLLKIINSETPSQS